jgi:hypothetical protein
VIVRCPFLVNPWVKTDVVKSGEVEVIETIGMDAGCPSLVVNPGVKVDMVTPGQMEVI